MNEALKELFQRRFGEPVESTEPINGDGSGRKLFRLTSRKRTAVGAVNADPKENKAFVEFSRHFRKCGVSVPEIYAEDLDQGIYLEEDLGDATLFQFLTAHRAAGEACTSLPAPTTTFGTAVLGDVPEGAAPGAYSPPGAADGLTKPVLDIYRQVVEILPKIQIVAGKTLNYKFCYPRACFDKQSMTWDLNYFKYYFLRLAKIPFDEQALENDFKRLVDFLLQADRDYFLYRDFQSRNVMIKNGTPYFIDYQGGRKGALQYDIASLLSDAKADIPFDVREDLLEHYLDAASAFARIDRKEFMRRYYGFVYIRMMQAFGAYGLRGFYERKQQFLQSIPYAIRNVEYLLRTVELPVHLPALMQVFKRLVASSGLRQFGEASLKLTVRVQSFSYRDGVPQDEKGHGGGFVFDCRALPNPGREKRYCNLSGQDEDVIAYLEQHAPVHRFLEHVFALVDQSVEDYRRRNFTDLFAGFGCTGGRHRSVFCAERLARHLREKYKISVQVNHCGLPEAEAQESAGPAAPPARGAAVRRPSGAGRASAPSSRGTGRAARSGAR